MKKSTQLKPRAEYSRRYQIINEIFNAITHGIGLGLSITGLVLLMIKAVQLHSPIRIVTFAIYGSSLILLYLFSTLFHSLIFTKAQRVFQIFDHCSIYFLIAGTYTPYCLVTIQGWLGWTLFGIIWFLAILGMVYKSIWVGRHRNISTIIYIIMGWLCMLAFIPLYHGLGPIGFWLLVAGGLSFTLGAGMYTIENIRFQHVIWHFFVLMGTIFMFFSIYLYV